MSHPHTHSGTGRTLNILLALGAVGTFLVFACCGGIVGFFLYNMGQYSYEVTDQVREHPVIQEHIGTIQYQFLDPNVAVEAREQGNYDAALDLQGSKGRGVLLIRWDDDDDDRIRSATLQLPSGDEVVVMEE